MRGLHVPHDAYVTVVGTDLIRLPDGHFAVLEDNLRVPCGVSYMLANRQVMKRVFPALFRSYGVRPIDHYGQALLATLRTLAPAQRPDPTIVLLTPGVFNSAYFEHAFLARQMGIELVEGRDLLVHDNVVYMRTTAGLRRVDVIYRRIDDDFIDPLIFRSDSIAGRAGPVQRLSRRQCRARQRASAPASPTTRRSTPMCRRSSATTWARSRSCPTSRPTCCATIRQRAYVLENLDKLVVKAVGESGGYGMLIGPHSTADQRDEFRQRIMADPRNYIAQPTLLLSRAPCFIDGQVEARHVDLRPYILFGERGDDRARRPDPRRAAARLAGGQLLAGRRQQRHLGTARVRRSEAGLSEDEGRRAPLPSAPPAARTRAEALCSHAWPTACTG